MAISWDPLDITGEVRISISRQGGKDGTFETIVESTENDGRYDWTVTKPGSVNCVLKIEPLSDPSKVTTQKLFTIRLPVLSVTPTFQDVSATSGTITFEVENTGTGAMNWIATTENSWITVVNGITGTNSGLITLNYQANLANTRIGTITVTASDAINSPQTVEVIQLLLDSNSPLPDTGQTRSYTDTFGEDSDYNINPPTYTKLDTQGNDLSNDATEWVMVRDNVTGLIWEVKTDDGSVHDKHNEYTWYDSNPETNGGNEGTPGDGTDTEDFVQALNDVQFGSFSDWRIPTIKELESILNCDNFSPAIKTEYFPNTMPTTLPRYWSSITNTFNRAFGISFNAGDVNLGNKSDGHYRACRARRTGLAIESFGC